MRSATAPSATVPAATAPWSTAPSAAAPWTASPSAGETSKAARSCPAAFGTSGWDRSATSGRDGHLVDEGGVRLRVEDVELLGLRREHELVSGLDPVVRGDERDEVEPARVGVDELLGAEVLDDVRLALDHAGRRAVGGQLEMLRADAEH